MRRCFALVALALGCGRIGFGAIPHADSATDTPPTGDAMLAQLAIVVEGNGRVTSSPPGIDCPGTCTAEFVLDSPVTLSATPTSGDRFLGWDGTACARNAACATTVVVPADDIAAVFTGTFNVAFASSTTFAADQVAPDTASAACQSLASAAGLPGTYIGWISSSTASAATHIGSASGWVTVDGLPFAQTAADLVAANIIYPAAVTEIGGAAAKLHWTGTSSNGAYSGFTCNDWTSTAIAPGASSGWDDGVGPYFTDAVGASSNDCTSPGEGLLCLGVDHAAAVPIHRHAGRLAFVSTASWTSGGGRSAADAVCAAEATAAGLGGAFLALLPTDLDEPWSRFDLQGATWVRRDGARVFRSALEIAQPPGPRTAIALHADGSASGEGFALTGAVGMSCANWTDSSSTTPVPVGLVLTTTRYLNGTGETCGTALPVYCIQE